MPYPPCVLSALNKKVTFRCPRRLTTMTTRRKNRMLEMEEQRAGRCKREELGAPRSHQLRGTGKESSDGWEGNGTAVSRQVT